MRIEVLVFIGRDLHPAGGGLYFQDVGSFLAGDRFDPATIRSLPQAEGPNHGYFTLEMGDVRVGVYPAREYAGVQGVDEAMDSLQDCFLRHRQWDGTPRTIVGRPDD